MLSYRTNFIKDLVQQTSADSEEQILSLEKEIEQFLFENQAQLQTLEDLPSLDEEKATAALNRLNVRSLKF